MIRVSRAKLAAAALLVPLFVTVPILSAGQTKPTADPNSVKVTVKYAGKGAVDANHRLWIWLFDNPQPGPGSIPIGEMSMEKNGGTVTFTGVSVKPVYIAIAYDEKGGFAGQAPPPPGSPVALYGAKSATDPPTAVIPGPKGVVTWTFTDAQRMQ